MRQTIDRMHSERKARDRPNRPRPLIAIDMPRRQIREGAAASQKSPRKTGGYSEPGSTGGATGERRRCALVTAAAGLCNLFPAKDLPASRTRPTRQARGEKPRKNSPKILSRNDLRSLHQNRETFHQNGETRMDRGVRAALLSARLSGPLHRYVRQAPTNACATVCASATRNASAPR